MHIVLRDILSSIYMAKLVTVWSRSLTDTTCLPWAEASGCVILVAQTLAGILIEVNALAVEPLPHGRAFRISGTPIRGQRVDAGGR